jgi:hypothetical protein
MITGAVFLIVALLILLLTIPIFLLWEIYFKNVADEIKEIHN